MSKVIGVVTSKGLLKKLLVDVGGLEIHETNKSFPVDLGNEELKVGDTLEIEIERILCTVDQDGVLIDKSSYGLIPYKFKVKERTSKVYDIGELTDYKQTDYVKINILYGNKSHGSWSNKIVFNDYKCSYDQYESLWLKIHKIYKVIE